MEISKSLICPCNGKLYASKITLKAHQKTMIHTNWENNFKVRDLEIRATRLDNENGHLRRLNILLMERIAKLEKEI
jgi:hypothetical protein